MEMSVEQLYLPGPEFRGKFWAEDMNSGVKHI